VDSHRLNRRRFRSGLCRRAAIGLPTLVGIALWPVVAHASFLPPDLVDKAADVLAVVVLILVPVGGIYLFWKVHVLPEIVAEKRHHPQKDAIKTLCILSLFFGGLLWPIAWLWAYSKPVMYKLAYGTDKHEDFYKEQAEPKAAEAGEGEDVEALKAHIAKLEARVAKLSKKEGRAG
jgi:CBS domain containing-hemolysin-like protein